jgi:hypothetical protein
MIVYVRLSPRARVHAFSLLSLSRSLSLTPPPLLSLSISFSRALSLALKACTVLVFCILSQSEYLTAIPVCFFRFLRISQSLSCSLSLSLSLSLINRRSSVRWLPHYALVHSCVWLHTNSSPLSEVRHRKRTQTHKHTHEWDTSTHTHARMEIYRINTGCVNTHQR